MVKELTEIYVVRKTSSHLPGVYTIRREANNFNSKLEWNGK
jgi:hypothetical protein